MRQVRPVHSIDHRSLWAAVTSVAYGSWGRPRPSPHHRGSAEAPPFHAPNRSRSRRGAEPVVDALPALISGASRRPVGENRAFLTRQGVGGRTGAPVSAASRRAKVALTLVLVPLLVAGTGSVLPHIAGSASAASGSAAYFVTFHNAGLGAGRPWGVSVAALNGSPAGAFTTVNATAVLNLAPGTYTYNATPPTGWVWVHGGTPTFVVASARSVAVPFRVAPGFGVFVLHVRGLLPGTVWSVSLNWTGRSATGNPLDLNATVNTTTGTIRFATWIGAHFFYQVDREAGYVGPSIQTGTFNASVTPLHEGVRFWGPLYAVTFQEVGLANVSNQSWGVNFSDNSYSSNGSATIVVSAIRGTGYWFRVVAPAGYVASPGAVSGIRVRGPVTFTITFTAS